MYELMKEIHVVQLHGHTSYFIVKPILQSIVNHPLKFEPQQFRSITVLSDRDVTGRS